MSPWGEFIGDPADPYAVIGEFLTEVVDPLVREGRIQWATYSQMADAYVDWEAARPGEQPRDTAVPAGRRTSAAGRVDRGVTYGVVDGVELKWHRLGRTGGVRPVAGPSRAVP